MTSAKGYNGTITFDGGRVTLERSGFVARATHGQSTKVIPLAQVSAVQWKPAGFGIRGYLELTLAGGMEAQSEPAYGMKSQNVANENAVVFNRKQAEGMRLVYDEILAAI
jgi:hypothetical protein